MTPGSNPEPKDYRDGEDAYPPSSEGLLSEGVLRLPPLNLPVSDVTRIVAVFHAPHVKSVLPSLLATAIMYRSVLLSKGAGSDVELKIFPTGPSFANSGCPLTAEESISKRSREVVIPRSGQKIFVVGLENTMRVVGQSSLSDLASLFIAQRAFGNEVAGGVAVTHAEDFGRAAELARQYPEERLFFSDLPSLLPELHRLRVSGLADDPILLKLEDLYTAVLDGESPSALDGVMKVLDVIGNSSSIFTLHHPEDRVDCEGCLRDLVLVLSSGEALPEDLAELGRRSDSAKREAERYIRSAEELAPGIIKLAWPVIGEKQLVGDSFVHVNTLVKREIDASLDASSTIKVVLYWSPDLRPTSLTVEEGEELGRRLDAGEAPDLVFREMMQYLGDHGDRSRLMMLHLDEMRERELEPKIREEIERSRYITDPEGSYYLAKCPKDIDREAIFRMAESELDSFDCGWLISFGEGGGAQRMSYSFQAKYLESVVRVLSRYL